jgi:hypothetical protein
VATVSVVLLVAAVVINLVPSTHRASADTVSVVGHADAAAIRATYTVPNFLVLSTIADVGGPVASSMLDSSGTATGYSSVPYPGNTVVTAPGLLSVLFGLSIPLTYPFYAEATAPLTPKAHRQDASGTINLDAAASSTAVTGSARLAPSVGALTPAGSTSTTSATLDGDGNMTVTADVITKGLDLLNGVIRIGSVHSHSVTTFKQGDAAPKTTSTTTVEAASVAGIPVSIGTDGVKVLGQPASNPLSALDRLVNGALGAAGIGLKTTSVTPLAGGQMSSALEIDSTHTIPVGSNPKGTLVMLLGAASTSIALGSPLGGSSNSDTGATTPAAGDTSGGSTPAAPTPAPASVPSGPTNPTAEPAVAAPAFANPAVPVAKSRAPKLANPVPAGPASVLLARDLRHTWRVLYIVFLLGAIAFLAASVLWRTKGVHPTWIS